MNTKRIERLLKLIQALQAGRANTVKGLAALVGVSRRTVFRDLELLSRAGIHYTFDRHSRRYDTDSATLLPPVTLTHAEALALLVATRFAVARQLVPDPATAISVSLKVESMLPRVLQDSCGPLLGCIEVRPAPASDPESIGNALPALQNALARRVKIQLRYDSYAEERVVELVLHPYRLAYIHRGWYVIGFSELHDEHRTFKVERIVQIRILEERFRIDDAFDLDDYFGNAWMMIRGKKRYRVRIRFGKKVAANVDEIAWHKTQRTHYEENGSMIFEADVDGVEEISWWVLGYGDEAEVLAPAKLRHLVARHARRMHAIYDGDGLERS